MLKSCRLAHRGVAHDFLHVTHKVHPSAHIQASMGSIFVQVILNGRTMIEKIVALVFGINALRSELRFQILSFLDSQSSVRSPGRIQPMRRRNVPIRGVRTAGMMKLIRISPVQSVPVMAVRVPASISASQPV